MKKEGDIVTTCVETSAQAMPMGFLITKELVEPVAGALANTGVVFLYRAVEKRKSLHFLMPILGPSFGKAMGYNT